MTPTHIFAKNCPPVGNFVRNFLFRLLNLLRNGSFKIVNLFEEVVKLLGHRMSRLSWAERIQEALKQINGHGASLDQHAESVTALEGSLEYHEKNLAASLQNGSETGLDETLSNQHAKQSDLHERQQEAHERIKKHHHTAMAQVAILKAALEAAM